MKSESSSGKQASQIPSEDAPLAVDSFSLDDAIQMHLVDCERCRSAINAAPVKLGEKSRHCPVYFEMLLMRADYEGRVNNITNRDEYGNIAIVRGHLEP